MTMQDLKNLWTTGDNSFQQDPPNAALTLDDKTAIIVLHSLDITDNIATFSFTMDDNSQDVFTLGDQGKLHMLIDHRHG